MKACTALPWSSVRIGRPECRLPPCIQHTRLTQFSRRSSSTEPHRNPASPIVSGSPADDATPPSFDIDQDKKTIATPVGRLPLSPVMDPSYWAATTRHQAPKSTKGKAQNSVERQFRRNPYAQALATPLRQCTATRQRLPSFFLQDFNLLGHPETNQPWWVPRSLAWKQPTRSDQADAPGDEHSTIVEERDGELVEQEMDSREPDTSQVPAGIEQPATPQSSSAKVNGPSAYVVARHDLISAVGRHGIGFKNTAVTLFGGSSSRYTRLARNAVWREDMHAFILDRMRQGIVQDLLYLSKLCVEDSRQYIVKCHGWDDVRDKHTGSVLWLGDVAEPDEVARPGIQPGPFATYDITYDGGSTSVAVHNIPMLLGLEATTRVRQEAAAFSDGTLFMFRGSRTAEVETKLWKLQGYLVDYTEFLKQGDE